MNISSPPTGITSLQAEKRLAQFGPNVLQANKGTPWFILLARQFSSALILLLIAAAVVTALMGHFVDAVAIAFILVLNGGLGFVQEWRAEQTLQALRSLLTHIAIVIRDGQEIELPTEDLVPDDWVILKAGDKVPADIAIKKAVDLKVDESVLTGEAESVSKIADDKSISKANLFMGTNVVSGRAEGIVVATGMTTEFGRIAQLTTSLSDEETHLQKKLGLLGRRLGLLALGLISLIVILGWAFGKDPTDMVLTGISLAVAAVPEGLPAVVTITLALGARAMVRKQALIRTLQATETLGAATVICTDKTGTLTENQMTVTDIWLPSGEVEVTGTGYEPQGEFVRSGETFKPSLSSDLGQLLQTALVCNHARITFDGTQWQRIGEPTEAALTAVAQKAGIEERDPAQFLREIPFSSDRKRMTIVETDSEGCNTVHVKGALEKLLPLCTFSQKGDQRVPMSDEVIAEIEAAYEDCASRGLRVLSAARKVLDEKAKVDDLSDEALESELTFLGLFAIIDPPRPEVSSAIAEAHSADIKIVMITGDAAKTAQAIAQSLGLTVDKVLTGDELKSLPDAELDKVLEGNVLFARTTPEHKMRIVQRLQENGHIVAMTGDGVNDAPALKRADIGVAMGIRGTEVAKDASDIVLMDDNFASIIAAIREGRRQYQNIKKFVRYLLTSNAGEIVAISANIVIGGPLIFVPIQILWMNLITDGVTALSLSAEKSEADSMSHQPRHFNEDIVGKHGLIVILLMATYTGSASLWVFYSFLDSGVVLAQTAAFTTMIFLEKFSVFAFRSLSLPTHRIGFFSNPWLYGALITMVSLQVLAVYWEPLQAVLHTTDLPLDYWVPIIAVTLPVVIVPEIIKIWRSRKKSS